MIAIQLCPEVDQLTCSYCDLQEIELLYNLLLDKLSEASAYRYPTKSSNAKTIALKNKLLLLLLNKSHDNADNTTSSSYHLSSIIIKLDQLFIKESKSSWSSTMSSLIAGESIANITQHRRIEISKFHFPVDEGNEICKLIIRKLDINNNYHCHDVNCNSLCQFAYETCRNEGCNYLYSRKWRSRHDDECSHKQLSCPRECGEITKRMFMDNHLSKICSLRIVKCPLFEFGCQTGEITYFFSLLIISWVMDK